MTGARPSAMNHWVRPVVAAVASAASCVLLTACGSAASHSSGSLQESGEAITRPVTVGADGRTLTTAGTAGGCQTLRLTADETGSAVTLTLRLTTRESNAKHPCPADVRFGPVSVKLHTPLHGRPVSDGTTGKGLHVGRA